MARIIRDELTYRHPALERVGALTINDDTRRPFSVPRWRHSPATLLKLWLWQFEDHYVRFGMNLAAIVRDEKTGDTWTFEPPWFLTSEEKPPRRVWPIWEHCGLVSLEETERQKKKKLRLYWMPFAEYDRRARKLDWSRP